MNWLKIINATHTHNQQYKNLRRKIHSFSEIYILTKNVYGVMKLLTTQEIVILIAQKHKGGKIF